MAKQITKNRIAVFMVQAAFFFINSLALFAQLLVTPNESRFLIVGCTAATVSIGFFAAGLLIKTLSDEFAL